MQIFQVPTHPHYTKKIAHRGFQSTYYRKSNTIIKITFLTEACFRLQKTACQSVDFIFPVKYQFTFNMFALKFSIDNADNLEEETIYYAYKNNYNQTI